MNTMFSGRPVYAEISVEASTCDSYITRAWFQDGKCEELTDAQVDQLQGESATEICEYCMERQGGYRD